MDRAEAATAPSGGVAIGVGSGGTNASVGLSVSRDFLLGRDPDMVYADCMIDGMARLEPS